MPAPAHRAGRQPGPGGSGRAAGGGSGPRARPPASPGFVRIPDLVVVTEEAFRRVDRDGGLLRAADAVLAVEILSPGSVRTDRVIKRGEYADAGIPHHWMIDLDDGPSLTVCHLAGEFGYQDAPPERGVLITGTPFPLRIDVAALLDRP